MGVGVLQPQDVYVVLKIVAFRGDRAPSSRWAAELVMVPAGVHEFAELKVAAYSRGHNG